MKMDGEHGNRILAAIKNLRSQCANEICKSIKIENKAGQKYLIHRSNTG